MAYLIQKMRGRAKQGGSMFPQVVETSYTSLPVAISDSFLAPVPDPSTIKTTVIDFANSPLPEYKDLYAVVLDNVLSPQECEELIHLAEQSTGAHTDGNVVSNNGWVPAMVNAGPGHEFIATDYRNSDRIIWDNAVLVARLWQRIMQSKGVKEYLSVLEGEKYKDVIGQWAFNREERWIVTKQGVNERMRFLKYGPGQFFRAHCDGHYETPDCTQRSFFTLHLYLNDSAAALGLLGPTKEPGETKSEDAQPDDGLLRGGATTFHSRDHTRRYDVDPKAGRILIFQHARLLHSGDDVISGTKYTIRSDLMFEFESGTDRVFESS